MRKILILFVALIFISASSLRVDAAASVSGKYLKNINVVRAYFGSLKGVSKVSYTLMYNGNGVGQGVMGSFAPGKKKSVSKDFFLGTCSSRVCIYHKNIKNIQLQVSVKYSNGKTSTKTTNIK